jgi:hypothetical protein
VRLVDDDDDVVAFRQLGIVLAFVGQRNFWISVNTMRFVLAENLRISSLSLGCAASCLAHRAGMQEVAVNLAVQIVAVGHHHKVKLPRSLRKILRA